MYDAGNSSCIPVSCDFLLCDFLLRGFAVDFDKSFVVVLVYVRRGVGRGCYSVQRCERWSEEIALTKLQLYFCA
jgi:hypothetical protein